MTTLLGTSDQPTHTDVDQLPDQAYRLEPLRGLDGLRARPRARPAPGPGQVLVQVRAASLNRRDLMLMDGTYPLSARPGVVPLSDGVGDVIEVGPGVTRAAVGDRVTGTYFRSWVAGPQRLAAVREQYGATHDGWLARYVLLEEESVVHVPDHLTDAEAASLTCAAVAAWASVTKPTPPGPGETLLTVGSGAVALSAIQFARVHGARVVAVTSSPQKAKRLRELGAHEVVDRTETPAWDAAVRELTGGDGAEHVVDAVGLPTLPKSVAAAAYNARITLIGAFPAAAPITDPFGGNFVSIRRIAVGSRTDFEAMNRVLAAQRLRPVIARVFPFEAAGEAYRCLRDENPFGKVVVTL
ncbi:NAD(P)-dependent alcohol dehydrogenase [Streptacidiphilus pinicola]|uniref:NAD(P)-dependent alcohol dehydrogenase n=1 Tax=Streptacidiphilus pinicola TaxID=2219663 RepID=A0A2X0IUR8_9ACTN|nr:NAD(P)-dependent alcohol dehydrogenase [Streptacidiphilus pinicola]RAG81326.1 NAD(P)-dependent alcohol dehydrogenase [Streptacidiphilus pinicola]